jgi:hypothetical protein
VPPYIEPAKAQEESLKLDREDSADTIVIECITSDHSSESSDNSDNRDYIEEPLLSAKQREVRSSDAIRYAPDRS